jgi:hypothetical protein
VKGATLVHGRRAPRFPAASLVLFSDSFIALCSYIIGGLERGTEATCGAIAGIAVCRVPAFVYIVRALPTSAHKAALFAIGDRRQGALDADI